MKTQFAAGAISVALLALFIFSNTNGDITVWGDDVWPMGNELPVHWNYFTHANRGFTVPFYRTVFRLNGRNTQHLHVFYFCLFVLSALLFYTLLHKLLGAAPAAIGSVFYLAYAGKYEIVVWNIAGGYTVCANVFFLSVLIALSDRFRPWTKGAVIAAINWLFLLVYEILIVAAPLYPFLYWLHQRLLRKPVSRRAFAATCLPLLIFLAHVCVLYFGTPRGEPLPWQRGSSRSAMTLAAASARITPVFTSNVSTAIGSGHFALLSPQIEIFSKYVPIHATAIVEAAGACAAIAFLLWLAPVVRPSKAIVVPMAIAGVYLTFLSAMVGVTTFPGFTPSRLLTLTSIGLSLLVAIAASIALTQRFAIVRYGVPVLLSAVCGIEAAAMNSIFYQFQTSWAYDSHIRTQLLATGIKPQIGDTIFISLPPNPMDRFWRIGFSNFERGHIQTLLTLDYGLTLAGTTSPPLLYEHEIRYAGVPPVVPAAQPGHQLFCFSVSDNDYRLTRTDCPNRH